MVNVSDEIKSIELGDDGLPTFQVRQLNLFTYTPDEGAEPEPPHRHNFQELIWIKSGRGRQAVDGQITDIAPATFYLIAKGQVHQFLEAEKINGYVLRFNEEFRLRGSKSNHRHFTESFFNNVRSIPALSVERNQISDFDALFSLIVGEYDTPHRFGRFAILRHLLQVLLIKIAQNLDAASADGPVDSGHDTVFKDFIALLEEHFKGRHDVAFYADIMAVTARQLSERTKRVIGKTAKQVIEERLVLEAKRALKYTDRSVKEIAYALGYDDPSYFSKVFKKVTGYTPQEFQSR